MSTEQLISSDSIEFGGTDLSTISDSMLRRYSGRSPLYVLKKLKDDEGVETNLNDLYQKLREVEGFVFPRKEKEVSIEEFKKETLKPDKEPSKLSSMRCYTGSDTPNPSWGKSTSCITDDQLTIAIGNSIDRSGMDYEKARAMAQHVLEFFGYSDRIVDNALDKEDRDTFYMLEDSGLLTTEREETTLYDGREWRIHYWLFRKDRIKELVANYKKVEEIKEDAGAIYGTISEDIWSNRKSVIKTN